jgi:hypothetical protein
VGAQVDQIIRRLINCACISIIIRRPIWSLWIEIIRRLILGACIGIVIRRPIACLGDGDYQTSNILRLHGHGYPMSDSVLGD